MRRRRPRAAPRAPASDRDDQRAQLLHVGGRARSAPRARRRTANSAPREKLRYRPIPSGAAAAAAAIRSGARARRVAGEPRTQHEAERGHLAHRVPVGQRLLEAALRRSTERGKCSSPGSSRSPRSRSRSRPAPRRPARARPRAASRGRAAAAVGGEQGSEVEQRRSGRRGRRCRPSAPRASRAASRRQTAPGRPRPRGRRGRIASAPGSASTATATSSQATRPAPRADCRSSRRRRTRARWDRQEARRGRR